MGSAFATQPEPEPKKQKRSQPKAAASAQHVERLLDAHSAVYEALEYDAREAGTLDAQQRLIEAGLEATGALRAFADDGALWSALERHAAETPDLDMLVTYAREALPWLLERLKYRPPPPARELVHEILEAVVSAAGASPDQRRARLEAARTQIRSLADATESLLKVYPITTRPRRKPHKRLRRVLLGGGGRRRADRRRRHGARAAGGRHGARRRGAGEHQGRRAGRGLWPARHRPRPTAGHAGGAGPRSGPAGPEHRAQGAAGRAARGGPLRARAARRRAGSRDRRGALAQRGRHRPRHRAGPGGR